MDTLIPPTVNLLILVVAIVYWKKNDIIGMVRQRHVTVREEIAAVREQLAQAERESRGASVKVGSIRDEGAALRDQARNDARVVGQRVVEEARKLSAGVISDAKVAADSLFSEMKNSLYLELTGKVLDRAEAFLKDKLTGADKARISREFSLQVESA